MSKRNKNEDAVIAVVGLGVFMFLILVFFTALVVGPIITIWAVNTLFNAGIELTLMNWLAVFWLQVLLNFNRVKAVTKGKDK